MVSHGAWVETAFEKRKRQRVLVCQLVGELVAHAHDKQDAREIAELVVAGLDWAYGNGKGEGDGEESVQPVRPALRLLPC